MCDELPMIYLTCILIYNIYELVPTHDSKPRYPYLLPFLVTYAAVFTFFYLYIVSHPLFHQVMYMSAIGAMVYRSYWALNQIDTKSKEGKAQREEGVRVLLFGLIFYVLGK